MTEPPRLPRDEQVAAIILAGGLNRRMGGRDKAFLRVEGETVLARTVGVLRHCFCQIVVVTNTPERYATAADLEVTCDELPRLGPLGGLHAGLGRVRASYAFVTACDMPFLRVEPIRFLLSLVQGQDAIVPRWAGDIEPLHAIYARSLRPRIASAVAAGARAIRDVLPLFRVHYVPESVMARVAGAEESFRNVNTPEEAARFAVQLGA